MAGALRRRIVMAFAEATFLAVAFAVCGCAPGDRPVLRVATWNIAHGRGLEYRQFGHEQSVYQANIAAAAEVLALRKPDIVALQEADGPSSWSGSFDHVAWIAGAAGYPHVHHGLHIDKAIGGLSLRYGTVLLSLSPLDEKQTHAFRARPLDMKGFVTAEVVLADRRLMLVSLHLDSGSAAVRCEQADPLIQHVTERALPVILMGDFNAPWTREDDAVRIIASRLGLQAYRPNAPGLDTFRADKPTKRIDWILISKEFAFVDYTAWPEPVSDHLAVSATVRWRR